MSVYQEGHMGRGVGMSYGAHNDGKLRKDKKPKEEVCFEITVHNGEVNRSINGFVKICKAKRWEGGKGLRGKTLLETPVHHNSHLPSWNYCGEVKVKKEVGRNANVKIELLDKDRVRGDEVGTAFVNLSAGGIIVFDLWCVFQASCRITAHVPDFTKRDYIGDSKNLFRLFTEGSYQKVQFFDGDEKGIPKVIATVTISYKQLYSKRK
eukprot:Phypoly_transcript_18479.p1 GENE.Phypoly_transcript_18479~~Phypoly_transcript_18479.p1  ORF type:complete len:208 (+),score=19.21 Phypoly_transcript_18479:71-694(+)